MLVRYSIFECFGDQTAHLVKEGPTGSFEDHVKKENELSRGRGDQTAHCAIWFFLKMSENESFGPPPFPQLNGKMFNGPFGPLFSQMSRLVPFPRLEKPLNVMGPVKLVGRDC